MKITETYRNALVTVKYAFLLAFLTAVLFISGCVQQPRQDIWFDSYRDIPGITEEQIQAIGQLRARHEYFLYGMIQNDEAFYTIGGEIAGFSARMSDWLTDLFGIPFVPVIYDTISDLMDSFDNDTVHFTGQFPRISALAERFAMTDPISKRSVAIARVPGSRPLAEIEQERDLHILFTRGSALHNVLRNNGSLTNFTYTHVDTPGEAAELLRRGEADAYISDGVFTVSVAFPGFRVEPFFPFVFGYAVFSALNPELFPIVDAVQKILDNGGMVILGQLYAEGMKDAARHRMSLLLTDNEREFIASTPVIPIAVHDASYPISFYNEWVGEFQGISIDVLREIEAITGLRFEIAQPDSSHLTDVHRILREGEAYLGTGPFRAAVQEGVLPFLFTDGFFTDSYTLVSYGNAPIIGINELLYMCVGLMGNSIYDTVFTEMFPQHLNIYRFPNMDEPLDALENGDVDLIFLSVRQVLRANRLMERPGFRTNIVFDNSYDVSFAINENMPLLASIIDKSLSVIDTESISDFWMGRTFDFTVRVLQAQRPWLIGTMVLLVGVLIMSYILFRIRNKKEAMEHAEESNRAKTRFLARMSHEIRTPITAVLGISEIQLRSPDMPPVTEEAFAKIHDSANMLLGIVNDILDFSKIESGKMGLVNSEYEVSSLVSDATQLHMVYLEHKNIAFRMWVDENLPAALIGDELRIRQIMNNLLSNAFKYTVSGSVELSLSREDSQEGYIALVISIRDTGLGVTKEQLSALKANIDYTRFHERENPSASGTGLGIAIVYSLAQMMGAEINIESEVGKGTHVVVRIPQKTVSGSELLGKEAVQRLQNFESNTWTAAKKIEFIPEPMPYGKVLIVDDVDANLYVAQGLIAFYDMQIDTCISGHEAIEKVKQGNVYDIIFMDHMMPGLSGMETMKVLRNMGYDHPIVALTANAIVGQAEKFMMNGFDGFVSKPIQTMRLNDVLMRFVRDKQPPDVLEAAKVKPMSASQEGIHDYLKSADLVDKLQVDFARSHKNTLENISGAINSGDIETAHRLAHTLKGSAGLIHESALAELAGQIEPLLADGKAPDSGQLSALENELARVLKSIGNPEQAAFPSVLDKDKIKAVFEKIEPLLTSGNVESLNLLGELRMIPETAVLVRQIEEFEFDIALKNLSTLKILLGI